MYRAGPPAVPGTGRGGLTVGGLTVARAARRIFDEQSEAAADPRLRRYLGDLVRPYGAELRDEPFARACGQSYGEMAAALLAELTSASAGEPVDLIVCAFTVGDVVPGRTTAAYLSDLCPGGPSGFAVCDQGIAAPYTALRLMTAYRHTGSCERCVLVVTEQSAQHYDLPAPAAMPSVHAGVTLLLTGSMADSVAGSVAGPVAGLAGPVAGAVDAEADPMVGRAAGRSAGLVPSGAGEPGLVSRVRAGVSESAVPDVLAREMAALAVGRDGITLVTGGGLTCERQGRWRPPGSWEVITAPAGQPCTGTWWELAGCLDTWQGTGRRVLLADYDSRLGYLCAASIDVR